MKTFIIAGLISIFSINGFTQDRVGHGPGPVGDIVTCEGKFDFVVTHTAAVTLIQGLLKVDDDNYISMICKRPTFQDRPASAGSIDWNCTELRDGGGKWLVRVETSGVTHMVSAYVSLEQIYPLEPKALATLHCVVHE